MALKIPTSGQLLSLDIVEGCDAVPAAKKLLKSKSASGGMSTWDASSVFFEMHNLEVNEHPSPRTLLLLYSADLFFRLRWEILPAMEEGKCVIATPYVETALAFGAIAGLPKKWVAEVFRFAPKANECYQVNGATFGELGNVTSGFVEFCSGVLSQDLRPKFAAYFKQQEPHGITRLP